MSEKKPDFAAMFDDLGPAPVRAVRKPSRGRPRKPFEGDWMLDPPPEYIKRANVELANITEEFCSEIKVLREEARREKVSESFSEALRTSNPANEDRRKDKARRIARIAKDHKDLIGSSRSASEVAILIKKRKRGETFVSERTLRRDVSFIRKSWHGHLKQKIS